MLEDIAGGFAILMLFSIAFVVVGFFLGSVTGQEDHVEVKPPSRNFLILYALGSLVIAGYWTNFLVSYLGESERDWWMIALATIWVVLCLRWAFQYARDAWQSS